jgi:hypothetical protein
MQNRLDPDEFDAVAIEESKRILREHTSKDRFAFDNAAPMEVRVNCANYDNEYGCLTNMRCCMADDKACDYYEESVVPTLDKERIKKYKKRVGKKRIKGEKGIRYCECGNPLPKGKHFCEKCRIKNLKAAQKRAAAKYKKNQGR